MPLAASLKANLPRLRRYARALTGSQRRGDACVGALLEAVIADADHVPQGIETRLALYRMLGTICARRDDEDESGDSAHPWEQAADHRLSSLSVTIRQAFTLVFIEECAVADTALILDIDESSVNRLLGQASREIAAQVATNVLIIEDEPMIALELEQMVEGLGHSVCGIARTHGEALAAYSHTHPGLVLADIRLADGTSGINAVNDMLSRSREAPPIIFITAYAQRLLTGERPDPTFLITKPFKSEAIKALVTQIMFFDGAPEAVA